MLAILGGTPVIGGKDLHQAYPRITDTELLAVSSTLTSGTLWGPWGPRVRELERQWAAKTGTKRCIALSSGTAALHCALYGCDVGLGDEVIVPAYSFIATATAPLMVGAVPIFVDVDPETGNMDYRLIESAINERTRAIIVAHLHGLPADMKQIVEIARRYSLRVIEDAAQAHAAEYDRTRVGSIGDVGIFSLNATKALAGPEGGLLTTDSDEIFNRTAKMRVFGAEWRDGEQIIRDADSLGFNYRFNEVLAAFVLARLTYFDGEQVARIENATRVLQGIGDLPGVHTPPVYEDRTHTFQMIRLRLDPTAAGYDIPPREFRNKVMQALQAEGSRWWVWESRPLPDYQIFQTLNGEGRHFPWSLKQSRPGVQYGGQDYPVSLATSNDSLFTTSHFPPNTTALMDLYIEAFEKVWTHLDDVVGLPLKESPEGIQEPF